MEVCPETELIAIEASATVCDDAFQIGERFEVLVGERLWVTTVRECITGY